jgi:hypothetical protein
MELLLRTDKNAFTVMAGVSFKVPPAKGNDLKTTGLCIYVQVSNFNQDFVYKSKLQGAAFNVTHFESRITHLLYTAINATEHG